MLNERGMSLIEALIGVTIASLVLAACYGSYIVVTGYYRTQNDISNVPVSYTHLTLPTKA